MFWLLSLGTAWLPDFPNADKTAAFVPKAERSLVRPSSAGRGAGPAQNVPLDERKLSDQARNRLQNAWTNAVKKRAGAPAPLSSARLLGGQASKAMDLQRLSVLRTADEEYVEPEELRSKDGELNVPLDMAYAMNHIGKDPVHLRNYNGKLVGPTLRVKPGDTIRMTLNNNMAGERWRPDMMNTLNLFNTTNMHFHGLHVSPNGISDNVLIEVGPKETQQYVVHIPKNHTPGTYWYHPHRHGSTAGNVGSGMSGALIIEGGLDDIPEIKVARDRTMVLNQIPYLYKNVLPDPNSTSKPPKEVRFNLPYGEVEEKYQDYIFGPGTWETLGRPTTINGVAHPVIRMNCGEVERWRLVDSGMRETINLQLIPASAAPPTTATNPALSALHFEEIADDGLALGKKVDTQNVELWPGYRSDVLVKAPPTPGEYYLIDAPSSAAASLNGQAEVLNPVARVVVSGPSHPMPYPTDHEMAGLRLPSIRNSEITGKQSAQYGILLTGGAVTFTIDGAPFSMETARTLKLNDVDEWTISTNNTVENGFVTHPFHIHVNPFEVTSIMAPKLDQEGNPMMKNGQYVLEEQLKHGRVWRDTVKIPGNGYVKMRTRYTDFIGTFVQHCHILDHEDQGMMQLIDIVDPKPTAARRASLPPPARFAAAPDFSLPNAQGRLCSLADAKGRPVALFFFKGHGCLHCSLQVAAFQERYEDFRRRGVQVIGVTSDEPAALRKALADKPCPFPVLADPKGVAFAKFGCAGLGGLQHGTFALDSKRKVLWSAVGSSPYLKVGDVLDAFQPSPSAVRRSNARRGPAQRVGLAKPKAGLRS